MHDLLLARTAKEMRRMGDSIGEDGQVSDDIETFYESECQEYDKKLGKKKGTTFAQMSEAGHVDRLKTDMLAYYQANVKPVDDLMNVISRLIHGHSDGCPIEGENGLYNKIILAMDRSDANVSFNEMMDSLRLPLQEKEGVIDELVKCHQDKNNPQTIGVPSGKSL